MFFVFNEHYYKLELLIITVGSYFKKYKNNINEKLDIGVLFIFLFIWINI
jgi:hypothetical protein